MDAIQPDLQQGLHGLTLSLGPDVPGQTAMRMVRQQRLQGLIAGGRRHRLGLIRDFDAVHGLAVIDRSLSLAKLADALRLQKPDSCRGQIVVDDRHPQAIGRKTS